MIDEHILANSSHMENVQYESSSEIDMDDQNSNFRNGKRLSNGPIGN